VCGVCGVCVVCVVCVCMCMLCVWGGECVVCGGGVGLWGGGWV